MDYHNIVSIRTYLTDPSYDEANVQLRIKYMGNNRPASTVVCCQLLNPKWKLEVEAMAAKLNLICLININSQKRGNAYIVIKEADLANLIKKCKQAGLLIGDQVGILSYNDTPLKEVLLDGITVMSTDHELMGRTAAKLILERRTGKIKNPFSLIKRNSL